jgi:hypothetical protein
MRMLAFAVLLALAGPAAADPNPQLVRSVEQRLASYGLSADVSRFATPTVAALHLTLVQREPRHIKRQKLQTILADPVYKE